MRFRWTLLAVALLAPAGFANAQAVSDGFAGPLDWSGDGRAPARGWASADYLLWWTKSSPLPVPLVTTSNTTDLGALGLPSTHVLIGDENLGFPTRQGGRFTAGLWLDDAQTFGVEGSGFFLASAAAHRIAAVNGLEQRVLAIPFFDATPGGLFGAPNQENGFVFGAPINVVTATGFAGLAALNVTDRLWGAEANGVLNVAGSGALRLELLGGFRYLFLREKLEFDTSSPTVVPPSPEEFFVTTDSFDARNDFYGGQVGARASWDAGRLTVAAGGKVALGVVEQRLAVNGSFSTNDFNIPFGTGPGQTFRGGYFALPSNIGTYHRDHFGVVPEADVSVGYRLTPGLNVSLGYTFLYVNSVLRPGDQIDRVINGGQSALYTSPAPPTGLQGGPARPAVFLRDTDFWAQGITFSVELRF